MRKLFSQILFQEMRDNNKINLVTADMGYGLFDVIQNTYPNRFFNVGSAEQLMIGMAAGMAMDGKIPICYSITPFAIYRPFEFIRNFMNHDLLPIKIVGSGRNKDYGYLGFTHWAEEDINVMNSLKNIRLYKPEVNDFLPVIIKEIINSPYPCYINLIK